MWGARPSPLGDKSPFELEAGLFGELPLQRREARGKIDAARGKLAQIRAKQEYLANKVTAEVQDAIPGPTAAADRIEQARTNVDLALSRRKLWARWPSTPVTSTSSRSISTSRK